MEPASVETVELTLAERIILAEILAAPIVGVSWVSLRILEDLRQSLQISEEELDLAGVEEKPEADGKTRIEWKTNISKAIPMSPRTRKLVVRQLETMSKAEILFPRHHTLCKMFLGDPPETED